MFTDLLLSPVVFDSICRFEVSPPSGEALNVFCLLKTGRRSIKLGKVDGDIIIKQPWCTTTSCHNLIPRLLWYKVVKHESIYGAEARSHEIMPEEYLISFVTDIIEPSFLQNRLSAR